MHSKTKFTAILNKSVRLARHVKKTLQWVLSFSEEQSKCPFRDSRCRSNGNPEMLHVFFNGSPSLLPYTFSLKSSLFQKESCPTPQPRIPAAFISLFIFVFTF